MKNIKKILGLLLVMTLLVGSVFALASCGDKGGEGGDPKCEHVDVNDNGKCDKCEADFEDGKDLPDIPDSEPAYVTYTVTVKDAAGNAVAGATVKLVAEDGNSGLERLSGNDGKVVFEPGPGNWKVQLIAVPDGYKAPTDYTAIAFDANGTATFVVEAK